MTPSDANPHPEPGGGLRNLAGRELLLTVLALGFLVYAPSLRYQFVYDDASQIVANPRVQSWDNLPAYFTSHAWAQSYGVAQANYYRPLFLLWLLLNHTLFGLSPLGWHLTTVLAHLTAASLLYALAREWLNDARAAALAALVFVLHPAQVESVAWVSGVSEPLTAIFLLGGLLAYVKFDRGLPGSRPRVWLAVSLLAYFLAMLSKETAVILPVLVFLYAWNLGKPARAGSASRVVQAIGSCLLYALPLAAYLLLRSFALHGLLHSQMKVSLGTALLTTPSLAWLYLKHLFFPLDLALYYDTPYVEHPGLTSFLLPLAGALLAAVVLGWWGRKPGLARACALWMAAALALPLASAALFPHFDLTHDRYLYLPIAGLALLLGEGCHRLPSPLPGARPAAVAALALLLAGSTLLYERSWADDLTLYRRSVELSPGAMLPKVQLAGVVEDQAEALRLLQDAEAVSGGYWLTQYGLGRWYFRNERYPEAEQSLLRGIERNPDFPLAYYQLGEVRLAMHQPERAAQPLRRAVEMVPDNVNYRLRYATCLELSGDLEGALVQLRFVLARLPREEILRGHIAKLERAAAEQATPAPAPR